MNERKAPTYRYRIEASEFPAIGNQIRTYYPLIFDGKVNENSRAVQEEIFLVLAGWKWVGYIEAFTTVRSKQKGRNDVALQLKRYLTDLGLVSLVTDSRQEGRIEAVIARDDLHLDVYTAGPDDEVLGRLLGAPESSIEASSWLNFKDTESLLDAAGIVTVVDFDLTPDNWQSELELLCARQVSLIQAGLLLPADVPDAFDKNEAARSVSQAQVAPGTTAAVIPLSSRSEADKDEVAQSVTALGPRQRADRLPLGPEERHQLIGTAVRQLRSSMSWTDVAATLNASGPDYRPARALKWSVINLQVQFRPGLRGAPTTELLNH